MARWRVAPARRGRTPTPPPCAALRYPVRLAVMGPGLVVAQSPRPGTLGRDSYQGVEADRRAGRGRSSCLRAGRPQPRRTAASFQAQVESDPGSRGGPLQYCGLILTPPRVPDGLAPDLRLSASCPSHASYE